MSKKIPTQPVLLLSEFDTRLINFSAQGDWERFVNTVGKITSTQIAGILPSTIVTVLDNIVGHFVNGLGSGSHQVYKSLLASHIASPRI